MKKISMILMAFALAITMSQCKKNEGQTTTNDEVVTITLDVKQNNDSKVVVNPNTGTVNFETGDKIYVGSGGKYVGFLTHNGTNFSGNITNPTENQPLQFYFLGNVIPQETLSAGTTEECSVIISDQTEHLPVISCAASNENYVSGVTAYSAHLLNKCALVKFNVTTPSNSPICITGMKNKVTVDFTQNTMTSSKDGEGVIMLPAGSGENVEKWAILLPQVALEEGEEGSAFTENGAYSGTRGAVPTICENGYIDIGVDVNVVSTVSIDHEYVDLGLPSGMLWATCNVGANAPEECGDYFAWGETNPKATYDWSNYCYCNGSENALTKYCYDSNYGYNGFTDNLTTLLPEDDAATDNWGSNWHIPNYDNWEELHSNTTCVWTTRNGVNGKLFTASNGNSIFIPVDIDFPDRGHYWLSSLSMHLPYNADYIRIHSSGFTHFTNYRFAGLLVRAVRSESQNNTPTGAIGGKFTVNASGDQVYFSQGNLQYQASTNTWKFADNQYDYVGSTNSNISSTYSGWIDLFGWGTSGYNHGANCYQPWSTSQTYSDYYAYGSYTYNLYDQTGQADWGYNPISNGGNQANQWRTLTQPEWAYIFNSRTTSFGICYAKARVNDVNGVILLPDDWSSDTYNLSTTNNPGASYSNNTITASQWNTLERAGAVFLPAAGGRGGTSVYYVGSGGDYWSASYVNSGDAWGVYFGDSDLFTGYDGSRHYGRSVRLVQDL